MKNGNRHTALLVAGVLSLCVVFAGGPAALATGSKTGETGFKEHCSSCHADGGNIIKQAKTLSKKDREKNGVFTEKDIMAAMRKPGAWCLVTFTREVIPDNEAKEIAKYISETFK